MKKQFIKKSYDASAEFYDKRYKELQETKYKKLITPLVIEKLKKAQLVLDIGAGTGLLHEYLEKRGIDATITGIDISHNMLKIAQEKGQENITGDADFLPFKKESFDVVVSFTTLQNLPSFELIFKEIKRVLKHEGLFIFSILRKNFDNSIFDILSTQGFMIISEHDCGEDIGFVCLAA